jgi:FtsH-binding integral membrane protein
MSMVERRISVYFAAVRDQYSTCVGCAVSVQVRHAFIRKLLFILTVQLLLVAAVAMPILIKKKVRRFLRTNPWVFFLSLVIGVTLLLVLACSEATRRRHPTNLLLLGAFTLAQGCVIGTASATYATNVPIVGVLITAAVSLALIVYALQTSVDFTASGGMLYSAVVVLIVVSLAEQYLGFKTLHLLTGGCAALLFCAYLVFDVQLLASGESSYAVSADEYVFGAINIYTDVINLFLYFVQLVSQFGDVHDELN